LEGDFFIGSADWMYRNLSRRVEVVAPIYAEKPKAKLWETLDLCLRDQRQAWILASDGTFSQLRPDDSSDAHAALGVQAALMELTRRRADQ